MRDVPRVPPETVLDVLARHITPLGDDFVPDAAESQQRWLVHVPRCPPPFVVRVRR